MSRRSTKAKAPKRPKANKKRKGKDSITGLSWDISEFGTIVSDQVYDKDSPQGAALLFLSDSDPTYRNSLSGWSGEIELSNEFIVFTVDYIGVPPGAPERNIERAVLQGDFQFKGRKLISAKVDSLAVKTQFGPDSAGYISQYGSGIQIKDPNSWRSWESSFVSALGSMAVSDQPLDPSFGGGKFFYEGWESNPFASNLI